MGSKRVTCSGCSLLCDDIIIRSDGLYIDEVLGACLKGKERFDQITAKNRILNPLIKKNGKLEKTSLNEAIEKIIEIIKNSSKPILYGFSTVSCEAQLKGIELARTINGIIDSNSTICQGKVLNSSKETGITLTTISEIINISLSNGAFGSKITGAGLGGCVITSGSDDTLMQISNLLEEKGYKSFLAKLDTEGARIER